MIVYSGKQFGNELNNGDEALFQDANRPRDNDMFKIQPGLQSLRRDWKKTNTNRMPSLFHAYGYGLITGYNPSNYKEYNGVVPSRIKFKSSYTESDFSDIAPYSDARGNTLTAPALKGYVNDAYGENGDAKTSIIDGGLEIMETGVYFLDLFAQFIMPSGYNYATNTSYPLFLTLLFYNDKTKLWDMYAYTQGRSCLYVDRLHETVATPITKGTRVSLGVGHSYTSAPILVACGITAVRMD